MDSDQIVTPSESNRVHEPATRSNMSRQSCTRSNVSDEEEPPQTRSRRGIRSCSGNSFQELDRRFDTLAQQLVSHVNNMISANSNGGDQSTSAIPISNTNCRFNDTFFQVPTHANDIAQLDVYIKESSVPRAYPDRVTKLASMQRFNSSEWNTVLYTEVQKKYTAFPAFTELKVNEELRHFDDRSGVLRWYQMERTYAALSNAFLAQNEFVNNALRHLIEWSPQANTALTPTLMYEKLNELFGNESDYSSVTRDILQIICGKRAEVLELRRKALLKGLNRKYVRKDIRKIPPCTEYMFNPEQLSAYLRKIGGIEKLDTNTVQPFTTGLKSKSPVRCNSSTSRDNSSRDKKNRKRSFNEKNKNNKKIKGGRKEHGHRTRQK